MARRKSIATTTIQAPWWEPHECAIIRSLTTEDEEIINDAIAGVENNKTLAIRPGRVKRLTIQRALVSWTLTDESGQPLPISEASIKALAPEDSQFLYDEIARLNAPMSEQEKKDSSTTAMPGSGGSAT